MCSLLDTTYHMWKNTLVQVREWERESAAITRGHCEPLLFEMRNEEDKSTLTNEDNNNSNANTNNNTENEKNNYTPRDKLLHLVSLLPNSLKDKENFVATMNKLGDRFSSFLGIDNKQGDEKEESDEEMEKNDDADINEDEFVLVRSNEDITNEIKDEELAKELQKQGIYFLAHASSIF